MALNPEQQKKKKNTGSLLIVFVSAIIFLLQVFRFINTEGNTHPLVDSLFNMTIILALIALIIHRKDFSEVKNTLFRQTTLDKYFNSIK